MPILEKEASNDKTIIFRHGCQGEYKDTGERYAEDTCYVKGIPCKAEEHHFGGIVVQVV